MTTTMKKFSYLIFVLLLIAVLSACSSSTSGSKDDGPFYEGETIEMLVPYETGGGTDSFARFVQPYLAESIEGKPTVQVVNVPGGGGVNGMNEFANFKDKNGLNLLTSTASTHIPYVLDEPYVEFDLNDFQPIVGVPAGGVVVVSPSTGIEKPEDILNPKEDLIIAGLSATGLDIAPVLAFELFGVDIQAIMGYEGRGPTRVSFMQGETNVNFQTTNDYIDNVQPLVDSGEAIPLFTFGQLDENGNIVRDQALPDIPTIEEVYEEVMGKKPEGEVWDALRAYIGIGFTLQKVIWTHKDAPEEAIAELTAAAEKLVENEEMKKEGEIILGGYEVIAGEELETIKDQVLGFDPEIVDWIKNYLGEKFGE